MNLRIKSPSARHSDLLLTCDRAMSVAGLKGLIEDRFPTRPPHSDQKLVYAGKLLTDDLMLEQFLRFEDDCSVFTIHLVCRIPDQATKEVATAPVEDGLRYRGAAAATADSEAAVVAPANRTETPVGAVGIDTLSAEARELARIQELLQGLAAAPAAVMGEAEQRSMEELYRQYVQLYSQHMVRVQQVQHSYQHQHHHHEEADRQLVPQPEIPAAPRQVAAADDEVNNNNDMLDRIYAITRIILLFSVIYFHSSFFRLLFVAVVAFLAHRFQNNNNNNNQNINRAAGRNNNNRIAGNNNNNEAHNNGNNRNNPVVDNANEATTGEPEVVVVEEEEEDKPNLVVVAVTFVSSFLSSILPGNNAPL